MLKYIYIYICVFCYLACCVFLIVFMFFTLSRKPRRVFKSFLGAVPRHTQIMGPWRAMATPFVSKVTRKVIPRWSYILKNHVSGVDFVIYGARKARDPARVVDDVEVCRKNHKFSENDLRKVPIVKWRAPISYQNSLSSQRKFYIKFVRRTGRPGGGRGAFVGGVFWIMRPKTLALSAKKRSRYS